jgi:hypothetical protein
MSDSRESSEERTIPMMSDFTRYLRKAGAPWNTCGTSSSPGDCPVARWLTTVFPGEAVLVDIDLISVGEEEMIAPLWVSLFAARIDQVSEKPDAKISVGSALDVAWDVMRELGEI